MAHEQDGDVAIVDEVLDALLAFLLEEHVANGERLVNDEDVGLGDGGDGSFCGSGSRDVLLRSVSEQLTAAI